ncbi:hypothetical protein BJY01DRAFT_241777 [Aspergillus pseudoustus]|uniref:Uncharacterized protein n=1 Tax=Aspergillus pseudoustus TaxID=1810923 RepID=A0ABR4L1N8_9EURO
MASPDEPSSASRLPANPMKTNFVTCQKRHKESALSWWIPLPHLCAAQLWPECVYPKRDRQVKVGQRQAYAEKLLRENKVMRARLQSSAPQATQGEVQQRERERATPPEQPSSVEEPRQNPLLRERRWFLPI